MNFNTCMIYIIVFRDRIHQAKGSFMPFEMVSEIIRVVYTYIESQGDIYKMNYAFYSQGIWLEFLCACDRIAPFHFGGQKLS